jgi:phosphoglycolate phosphatase
MPLDLSGCTIAFDLDGTLVDTAADLHGALNIMLAEENLPPVSLAHVRKMVGHGAPDLIARAGASNGVTYTAERLVALTNRYRDIYASDIAANSHIYPGVEDALSTLAAAGATLCVCTNKLTALSVQLLEAVGLAPRFAAIIGADSTPDRKPHPGHFISAIHAAKGKVSRAMMVGDSAADVGAARGAGAPVVVVSFGYTDTAPELLGADAVFSNYDELPGLAARYLQP